MDQKRRRPIEIGWLVFPYNTGVTKQADLLAYVFEGQLQPRKEAEQFSIELMQWMEASLRFTVFVETYRDKIRKKIRVIREPESFSDLGGELEVAYSLLNDRRLAVTYEPYASEKRRGSDFAITYRTNLTFNIEVAHIRVQPGEVGGIDLARKEERILRILMDKLGQMAPGTGNLLVIHTHKELSRSIDLGKFMQAVKTRAEGKDPAFYSASRYTNPADFYKDFLHLSGILLWTSGQLWINKQARPGLAENVLRRVSVLATGARQAPID